MPMLRRVIIYILIFFSFSGSAQWGTFGSFDENTCNCSCSFNSAPYKLYNVGGADAARIVTCEDDTKVWVNSSTNLVGTIDKDEVLELALSQGDIIYSCQPIYSSGELNASNRSLLPEYLANNILGATDSRYGGIDINIHSLTATTADIFKNGSLVTTVVLTAGNVTTFTQTGNYTGNWKVVADGLILGFKGEDNAGNGDNSAMVKPYDDLLGWTSTASFISKESGSATPTAFQVYSHLGNYLTGTIATTYNIVDQADLPHNGAQDNHFNIFCNVRVQSTENLYAHSRADSDGGDDAAFMPVDLLTTHHKIPQPCEYVAMSNLNGSPIQVFDETGTLVTTLTPTKVNTNPLAPYAVRYGATNGTVNIPLGYEFVCTEGVAVVYQPKGAGGFGSDDDETVSFGYNK